MAQLHGKQLRDTTVSLNKLTGTGIATFSAGTMSFESTSKLQVSYTINSGSDVVNKDYVDAVASGLDAKIPVKVVIATFSLIPLTGDGFTIDGYTVSAGDRVLVAAQAGANVATFSNGIYEVKVGSWERASDSDGSPVNEVSHGNFVFVTEGTVYEHTGWVLTITDAGNPDAILVGTESQGWVQFSEQANIRAGQGLSYDGQTLNVGAGTGITVSADQVGIANTTVAAGNYGTAGSISQFTVNAQGQLTGATSVSININSGQITGFATDVDTVIFNSDNFADGETIDFTVIGATGISGEVKLASLTASRLNAQNTPSANYILGYTASGQFYWFDPAQTADITSVNAGAGLTGGGLAGDVTIDIVAGNAGILVNTDSIGLSMSTTTDSSLSIVSGGLELNRTTLASNLQGSGLTANAGVLDINVNSDSLEIADDVVRLKNTITGDRTFQDSLTVQGNLTVNGTVSYINTENLYVEDNIITLNATWSGSPLLNAGIEVIRGASPSAALIWNETLDLWAAGLSGSESTIITEAGTGLSKSGKTLSIDFVSITGVGLTQNGSQISVDTNGITSTLAGAGLAANGGSLDVSTSNGLIVAGDSVQVADTISGKGLTFSSGVIDVNTGLGLTISSVNDTVEMIWGGTSSGLTFSNNSIAANVDGTTIAINNSGQLTVIAGASQPVYDRFTASITSGNAAVVTGVTLTSTPNDYSRVQVYVNGQLQRLASGSTGLDCYFDVSGKTINSLVAGDQLYWNGTNAGFDLTTTDVVEIIYES